MISNEFLRTLVIKITLIKQLLITILLFEIVDLQKISHIFQVHPSVKFESDKLFGSITLIVLMLKLTLVKFLRDSFISIFPVTIKTISYSTEITSN